MCVWLYVCICKTVCMRVCLLVCCVTSSSSVSTEDKLSLMVEWWSQAHTLLMEYGLKKSHLEDMVKTACIELR